MDADATTVAQAGAATFVEVVVDHSVFEVFLGIDVGKDKHYAVALDRSGATLLERELPQDETRLRTLIAGLATNGPVLAVVDQPASIGALVVAVARAEGAEVAYLPGVPSSTPAIAARPAPSGMISHKGVCSPSGKAAAKPSKFCVRCGLASSANI